MVLMKFNVIGMIYARMIWGAFSANGKAELVVMEGRQKA